MDNLTAWKNLGMDIPTHDAVLNIVGTMFGEVFLSQKNRPAGMDYFNTFAADLHGKRVIELMKAREEGRKVIGAFCVFVPEELVIAANAIQVGLCAGVEVGFEAAEQFVPRNTCALIKSVFGFRQAKVCPYMQVSDLIVGENTCDGKKKAYEMFGQLVPELYIMDIPNTKSEAGYDLMSTEYRRFADKLEAITGNKITPEKLANAISIVNAKRAALSRLAAVRHANPAPISGIDVLFINQVAFLDDAERFTDAVNKLCDELEIRVKEGVGVADAKAPRILISGCPMALPNWKLPNIIEKSGAVIVGEETCTGERGTQNIVVGNDMKAIIDRYFKIDCAVFTPNNERLEHIKGMAKLYNADGVIHYSIRCCTPYTQEAIRYEKELESVGVPTLSIETDYSQEDMGQLRTRIEAFSERIAR